MVSEEDVGEILVPILAHVSYLPQHPLQNRVKSLEHAIGLWAIRCCGEVIDLQLLEEFLSKIVPLSLRSSSGRPNPIKEWHTVSASILLIGIASG